MWVFLAIYLGIYGGMNAYACFKVCRAFGIRGPGAGLCSAFAALMVLLPLVLRPSERRLPEAASRAVGFLLFTWMAWVFWFICVHLCCDVLNLVTGGARAGASLYPGTRWLGVLGRLHVSARAATYAGIGWVACASVWGWFEAGRIRVRTVEIASARVPAGTAPVRLVQISDVHAGYTCRRGVFRKILRAVRAADPDILVSTGDMVDGHPPSLNAMADELAGVEAPAGKFAVVGNHEVYPGLGPSLAFHERAGFRMLRGTCAAVGGIRLCGVDDPAVQREAGSPVVSEEAALSGGSDGSLFTVLLKHRPEAGAGRELADLQLSGHIHGGQIFPFGLITGAVYGQPVSRLVATGGRLSLYISPGSGTWGPPFRVLAPPEVTLFLIGPED